MTAEGRAAGRRPQAPAPARLRAADLARLAGAGLATRKLRATLSALGIAIGVAAITAVLGLSQSSQAGLLAEIARLGTNLLIVQNGQTLAGGTAELPNAAPAMIGRLSGVWTVQDPAADRYLRYDGHPSTIYLRAQTSQVRRVYGLLAAQANPANPGEVNVGQPSAVLTAQAAVGGAFSTLFLGLGAVALLVGAVGVANIMVISVLERRSEIGLRRALGATRGHIRVQFLSEAIALSLAGGAAEVAAGTLATAIYAHTKGWMVVIPVQAWAGGLGAAVLIGAVAGLWPALRAARMSPTQALWTV